MNILFKIKRLLASQITKLIENHLRLEVESVMRDMRARVKLDSLPSPPFNAMYRDRVVPGINNGEQDLFSTQDTFPTLSSYFYFPSITNSDAFVVRVYVALTDSEFHLYDEFRVSGETLADQPVISLTDYTAPSIKLTIEQVTGLSRPVEFEIVANYATNDQLDPRVARNQLNTLNACLIPCPQDSPVDNAEHYCPFTHSNPHPDRDGNP